MLSGKKVTLVFFALLGAGVALFAMVWRIEGHLGFGFGVLGALLIISALKWLERAFTVWDQEKKAAKQEEEALYWGTSSIIKPQSFVPQENLRLRKKLSWWFGGTATVCLVLVMLGNRLHSAVMIAAFPICLWSLFLFAAVREKFRSEKPQQDFSYLWGESPVFRRNNLLFGILMWALVFGIGILTPPPPNAAPYVIGIFVGIFVVWLIHLFYIQFALEKGVAGLWEGWSVGEKRLSRIMDVLSIVLLMAGYPIISFTLPNLIEELYFALLYAGLGLVVGYCVHDFLKNRFTGFFDGEERKSQILLQIYICCLILTLSVAAIANRQTAYYQTEVRAYQVADKSKTYKKRLYLWLDIAGKRKRFEPKMTEWESVQTGDSIQVLVGKGILGFEHILKFEPRQ